MRYLQAIRRILTLKCDESERLISKGMDEDLSISERWAVRSHFISCKYCRRFRNQISLIRLAAQKVATTTSEVVDYELSTAARKRIEDSIRVNGG